jgi:hypothetical protein
VFECVNLASHGLVIERERGNRLRNCESIKIANYGENRRFLAGVGNAFEGSPAPPPSPAARPTELGRRDPHQGFRQPPLLFLARAGWAWRVCLC